jgi:hypothetical protein
VLFPEAITGKRRAIWALDAVRINDGGADGDGDTTADNTVFARRPDCASLARNCLREEHVHWACVQSGSTSTGSTCSLDTTRNHNADH